MKKENEALLIMFSSIIIFIVLVLDSIKLLIIVTNNINTVVELNELLDPVIRITLCIILVMFFNYRMNIINKRRKK